MAAGTAEPAGPAAVQSLNDTLPILVESPCVSLEANGLKADALLDHGANITVGNKRFFIEPLPSEGWRMSGATPGVVTLKGPVKISLTIAGKPFYVMAFQGDVDEDLILGHNFIYPHDLRPNPGDKVITIHRGSDGNQLTTPVTLPYTLKRSNRLGSYVIHAPLRLRLTSDVYLGANEQRQLHATSLRVSGLAFSELVDCSSVTSDPRPESAAGRVAARSAVCQAGEGPEVRPGGATASSGQPAPAASQAALRAAERQTKPHLSGSYAGTREPKQERGPCLNDVRVEADGEFPRSCFASATSLRQCSGFEEESFFEEEDSFSELERVVFANSWGDDELLTPYCESREDWFDRYDGVHTAPPSGAVRVGQLGGPDSDQSVCQRHGAVDAFQGEGGGTDTSRAGRVAPPSMRPDSPGVLAAPLSPATYQGRADGRAEARPQITNTDRVAPLERASGSDVDVGEVCAFLKNCNLGGPLPALKAEITPPTRSGMPGSVLVQHSDCSLNELEAKLWNSGDKPVMIPRGTVVANLELSQTVTSQTQTEPQAAQPAAEQSLPDQPRGEPTCSYPYTPHIVWTAPRSTLPPGQPLPAKLQEVVDRYETTDNGEKSHLAMFVREFSDVFSLNGEFGRCDWVPFEIDTQGNPPVNEPVRPIAACHREGVKKIFLDYLDKGIVRYSTSEYNSGLVVAAKKDGSLRCCLDLRPLNRITRVPKHPFPRVETILESLQGKKLGGIIDLIWGFHSMVIAEKDRRKTACSVPGVGHVEFNTLLFGAAGGPARFQHLLELVLKPCGITPMMDDIPFGARDFKEMLTVLRKIFLRLRQANLKVRPEKCWLIANQIPILGHIWTPAGISTDPAKTARIWEWPVPHNVTELKGFIGLCGYYAKFISSYADMVAPLHRLTAGRTKRSPIDWTQSAERAFLALKRALTSAPVLGLFDPDGGEVTVTTDASDVAIGMILAQLQEGVEKTLAYGGRVLNPAEKNYCITQRELLAIVEAVRIWHVYLAGNHFRVKTDHRALQWLQSLRNPQGRIARWIERLLPYDFTIEYTRPALLPHADALSRLPTRPCAPDCTKCEKLDKQEGTAEAVVTTTRLQPEPGFDTAGWIMAQNEDPYIQPILLAKQTETKPSLEQAATFSADAFALYLQYDSLVLRAGLLYRRFEHNSGDPEREVLQLVVPRARVQEVLELYHAGLGTGSHLGASKTLKMIRGRFYWPNYSIETREMVARCRVCGERRGPAVPTEHRSAYGRRAACSAGGPWTFLVQWSSHVTATLTH